MIVSLHFKKYLSSITVKHGHRFFDITHKTQSLEQQQVTISLEFAGKVLITRMKWKLCATYKQLTIKVPPPKKKIQSKSVSANEN